MTERGYMLQKKAVQHDPARGGWVIVNQPFIVYQVFPTQEEALAYLGKQPAPRSTHGLYKHPLYKVHQKIKGNACPEWGDVAVFVSWAEENGWFQGCAINRKNTLGGWDGENCVVVRPTNFHKLRQALLQK